MKGFRQLGEAEAVEIEFRLTEKGLEAVKVTGPNGDDCRGSKGPHPTKRVRKIRLATQYFFYLYGFNANWFIILFM